MTHRFNIGDVVTWKYDAKLRGEPDLFVVYQLCENHISKFVRVRYWPAHNGDSAFYEHDLEPFDPDDGGRASIDEGAEEYDMIMQMQEANVKVSEKV